MRCCLYILLHAHSKDYHFFVARNKCEHEKREEEKSDKSGKSNVGSNNSQLCCVEGEKERERMMRNQDRTRLFIIIITISHNC